MPAANPTVGKDPKQQPSNGVSAPGVASGAATNGYWAHDAFGPKYYVATGKEAKPDPETHGTVGSRQERDLSPADVHINAADGGIPTDSQVPKLNVAVDVGRVVTAPSKNADVNSCLVINKDEVA